MFTARYAGNWVMSLTFAAVAAIALGLPALVQTSGATTFLGQLVAAMAVAGVLVLAVNAARGKTPLFDWTDDTGRRLHPRATAALKGLGMLVLSLAFLLGYVSIFVFGFHNIIYFGLFMVVVLMSWILYITAGKHVS